MSKTVLIVDDSSSLRQVVNLTLTRAQYTVVEACDGTEALRLLESHRVNLIVSDVNMPKMDGITLLKSIKAMPRHKFTPVIMLTTEAGQARKEEGRAAGARAWIVKPFEPATLVDAVGKLIIA